MEKEVIQSLQNELALGGILTEEALRQCIIEKVNDLILNNFAKLTELLYRVDVDEERLKNLLNNSGEKDAAEIITDLIIQRQIQKFENRKSFQSPDKDIPEDEKW